MKLLVILFILKLYARVNIFKYSKSVIVEHMKHIGTIRVFWLPERDLLSFYCLEGNRNC